MTQKNESATSLPPEESTQIQHLLAKYHQLAQGLHGSSNQAEAEELLKDINSLSEAGQIALLKALSKERDSDAADVILALHELSPFKSIRKEARRSLIRLEGAKIYPSWKPPVAQVSLFQVPVSNPPRFWKGYVTLAREEGEVQLVLCWEQGYEYSEIRMLIFLLDFWEQGLKEYILENTNRRNVDAQLQRLRSQLPDVTLADCTLAEGRRLIEEALAVNKWRGTSPHKEYRHHLPTIRQLILDATDVGEDRGLTFINPRLEPDEVVGTFVGGWALGDYGLNYDMLTRNSSLRAGLERDEWIEQRRAWANEAHPTRFELGFIREREASAPALWLPSSFSSRNAGARKEVEIGWSLELDDTPLSGTLPEMPLGTVVYKETGRHWFWTSYTLVQEDGVWRIQQVTDEGAKAQSLPIGELQKLLKEYDERLTTLLQQQNAGQEEAHEVVWRLIHTLHYDDALMVQLPLDRAVNGDAYNRAIGLGSLERAIAYLQRLARNFAEQRGEVLRQLGITQESLSEFYRERGMNERATYFSQLAEASLREALATEETIAGHAVLAELLMRQGGRLDEAEEHLNIARGMITNTTEEAMIEADLGNVSLERNQLEQALQHYSRVAEIDPNFENIWLRIGVVQRNLNHLEDARAAYERAIEIQPRELTPYVELTNMYLSQGKLAEAREVLERGLRSNPKSAPLLALLSSVYLEAGDLRRAQAVLEEAEQANPRLEIVQAVREELDRRKKK
ncbi:MAG: tetratricopeptide repeat protein [Ktedonobacteraceae bacterium]